VSNRNFTDRELQFFFCLQFVTFFLTALFKKEVIEEKIGFDKEFADF